MTGLRPWLRRLGILVVLVLAGLVNSAVLMTGCNSLTSARAGHHPARHGSHPSTGVTLTPVAGQVPAVVPSTGGTAPSAKPAGSTTACKCSSQTSSAPVVAAASGPSQSTLNGPSAPAANTPEVPWPPLLAVVGVALIGVATLPKTRRRRKRSETPLL